MRYFIKGGIEIRTENSAKPDSQSSRFIRGEILKLRKVNQSLNYGSGKLRFLSDMSLVSDSIVLTDSLIQIERIQSISGFYSTNYKEFITGRNNVSVVNLKDLRGLSEIFDRAYCLNVLPVVPFPAIRSNIFIRINRTLKMGGELIVANRWRNSEFSIMKAKAGAIQFNDGTLIRSLRGYAYYHSVTEAEVLRLGSQAGFSLIYTRRFDGAYFIVLKKAVS